MSSHSSPTQITLFTSTTPNVPTIFATRASDHKLSVIEESSESLSKVSVRVTEWLKLMTSYHKVLGLNPAGGRIQLMTLWLFVAQSIIILPLSRYDSALSSLQPNTYVFANSADTNEMTHLDLQFAILLLCPLPQMRDTYCFWCGSHFHWCWHRHHTFLSAYIL